MSESLQVQQSSCDLFRGQSTAQGQNSNTQDKKEDKCGPMDGGGKLDATRVKKTIRTLASPT